MMIRRNRILSGGSGSRRRLAVALGFLLAALLAARVHGETREVQGLEFSGVVVRGSAEVEISQGDDNLLQMRGDDKRLDLEPFYMRGDTLYLGSNRSGKRVSDLQFKVSLQELRQLRVTGSGDVYVRPLEAGDLNITVEGSGEVKMHSIIADDLELTVAGSGLIQVADVQAQRLEMVVSGSGGVDLGTVKSEQFIATLSGSGDVYVTRDGETESLEANVVGSGDIDLSRLKARRADVNIVGSGDAMLWVEERLEVNILGSGDVSYRGDAEVDSTVLGSGDVERDD